MSEDRFTKEQARAIRTVGHHLCVDAGAGSGKTRVLVERIIHLLREQRLDLRKIVAITFMERAALEMKDRLRRACRDMAPIDNPEEMSYWRDIERQVDRARISTFHSLCAGILREYALDLGLAPDFTLLAEGESDLLLRDTVKSAVHGLLEENDGAALSLVVEHGLDRLLRTMEELLSKASLVMRVTRDRPEYDNPDSLAELWKQVVDEAAEEKLRAFAHNPRRVELLERLESFDGQCSTATEPYEQYRLKMISFLRMFDTGPNLERVLSFLDELNAINLRKTSKKNWRDADQLDALRSLVKNECRDLFKDLLPPEWIPERERRAGESAVIGGIRRSRPEWWLGRRFPGRICG